MRMVSGAVGVRGAGALPLKVPDEYGLRRENLSNACRWQLSGKGQTEAEKLNKVETASPKLNQ